MLHQQTPWQPASAWLECEGRSKAGEGRAEWGLWFRGRVGSGVCEGLES